MPENKKKTTASRASSASPKTSSEKKKRREAEFQVVELPLEEEESDALAFKKQNGKKARIVRTLAEETANAVNRKLAEDEEASEKLLHEQRDAELANQIQAREHAPAEGGGSPSSRGSYSPPSLRGSSDDEEADIKKPVHYKDDTVVTISKTEYDLWQTLLFNQAKTSITKPLGQDNQPAPVTTASATISLGDGRFIVTDPSNELQIEKAFSSMRLYQGLGHAFVFSNICSKEAIRWILNQFNMDSTAILNAKSCVDLTELFRRYHATRARANQGRVTSVQVGLSKIPIPPSSQLDSLDTDKSTALNEHCYQFLLTNGLDPDAKIEDAKKFLKEFVKRIFSNSWPASKHMILSCGKRLDEEPSIETLPQLFRWITADMKIYADKLAELVMFMPTASSATVVAKRDRGSDEVSQNNSSNKQRDRGNGSGGLSHGRQPKVPQGGPVPPGGAASQRTSKTEVSCNHCGRNRHKTSDCKKSEFLIGVDRTQWYNNNAAIAYAKSNEGKALLAQHHFKFIPREGKYPHNNQCDSIMNLHSPTDSTHTFPPLTFVVSLNAFNGASKEVRAFADSGATSGSYASKEVAEWLADNGTVSCMCDRVICGAVGSKRCVHASCCHELNVTLLPDKKVNNLINKKTIDIEVAILPLQYDIVIGLPTFRKHNLFQILAPLLNGELNVSLPDSVPEPAVTKPEVDSKDTRGAPTLYSWTAPDATSAPLNVVTQYQTSRLLGQVPNGIGPDTVSSVTSPHVMLSASAMLRASVNQNASAFSDTQINKSQIWIEPESWYSIVDHVIDVPGWLTSEEVACLPSNLPTKIWGTTAQRQQLIALYKKHSSVFSRTISTQAALVPPMIMIVDEEKWFTKGNQLAPRTMNSTKQIEVERRTAELVDQNVIRPCLASA